LFREISFPEDSSFPVIEGGNDVGEEPDGVVGRKERKAHEVSEHDEHKEVVDVPSLF
jgi:hypothetical protein